MINEIIMINTILNILTIVIIIVYPFLLSYISKKGEGKAAKQDAQKIEYEKRKGDNLATKEDIGELTEKIENVKNEISFKNQRKHEFINQRTERFINLLYYTEKLNCYQSILHYSLNNIYSPTRLLQLIEEINGTLLQFIHESRLLQATNNNDADLNKLISDLRNETQKYANFLCYIASNAGNYLNDRHKNFELAMSNDNNKLMSDNVEESICKFNEIRKEFEDNAQIKKETLYAYQIKYLSKLTALYGSDFHLKTQEGC